MANQPFITPEGRALYVRNLWTASRYKNSPDNPSKYRCSIAIPLSDPQLPALIADYNAIVIAELEAQPAPPGGLAILPRGVYSCLEFGSVLHPGDAFFADKIVLGLSRNEEDGAPKVLLDAVTPVIDKGVIYDGIRGRAHARFYSFAGGRGGINCEIFGLLKTADDEPVGVAAPDTAEAFAGVQGVGPSAAIGTPAPANFAIPGVQPLPVQPLPVQQVVPAQVPIDPNAVYNVSPGQPLPVQQQVQPLPVQPVPVQPAQQYAQPVQPGPVGAPVVPVQQYAQPVQSVPVGSLVQAPQPAVAPVDPYFDHVPF